MLKKLGTVILSACFALSANAAELPTEFAEKSRYRLSYDDLDYVLGGSVLVMGPSTHKRAKRARRNTASKVSLASPTPSRLEANRVMLDKFENEQVELVGNMRDDLLGIANRIDLTKLSKNDQLAFWLNLHNTIVLAEVAKEYPITNLSSMFDVSDSSAFINERRFDLNGEMISIRDIQEHVLSNWDQPEVIYGFYMGAVGTPNIRNSAFKGATVHKALKANAVDFVNSVRGTQIWKSTLKVSNYYEMMAAAFPNFETDVRNHIEKYASDSFKRKMSRTTKTSFDVEDWYIADLYNGKLRETGGTYASTTTDALGLTLTSDLPSHVMELLRYRDEKNIDLKATTDIEEVR